MPSIARLCSWLVPTALAFALLRCGGNPEVSQGGDDDASSLGGNSGTAGKGSGGFHVSFGGNTSTNPEGGAGGCGSDNCNENPTCGDGQLDPGEGCDDGNTRAADGCTATCKIESGYDCSDPGEPCVYTVMCGDGEIGGDEACDDHNSKSGDGCSDNCTVESGWECHADGTCTPTTDPPVCGDGKLAAGETCDDGNTTANDGCSDICEREDGYRCPTPGEACVLDQYCGDGRLSTGEQCDDGNVDLGDGCDGSCHREPFYQCPMPGKPCETTIVCGDSKVVGDEACDDGNTDAKDGCSADCKQVEAGYNCPSDQGVGGPCTQAPMDMCGDGRLTGAEYCDDGNTKAGDGCDANCLVEGGYDCPTAGMLCQKILSCGDGKVSVSIGEECDDGNTSGNDGCTATCVTEANYSCPSTGGKCTSLVVCGDKKVLGSETCDDGNKVSGDGCSSTCKLENGWSCPTGGKCKAAKCGDGITAGTEQCDDSNANAGDGCSSTCGLEIGFACSGSPSTCHATTCGDGVKEGFEQCDDHNTEPFDGCSPDCTNEPSCQDANGNRKACAATCGDGIVFPGVEACDDGNVRSGDGCSSTCKLESGFNCTQATDTPVLTLPVTFRDFTAGPPGTPQDTSRTGHPDFEWGSINFSAINDTTQLNRLNYGGFSGLNQGFARTLLGNKSDAAGGINLLGKPVFAYTTCPLNQAGTAGNWLRRNGVYDCANTVQSATTFAQWYSASTFSTPVASTLAMVRCPRTGAGIPNPDPVCAAGDAGTYLFDSNNQLPDGTICAGTAACDGFFPLDNQSQTKGADCGNGSPNGTSNNHNFYFTSQVGYWFQYQAASNATLSFRGDDDVFVYVNGHLVVDIGGIHNAVAASVTLNATTTDRSGALLNLQENAIYEILVFQAERNRCASNYRLQLKNFSLSGTTCTSVCGNSIVTPDEECDDGPNNVPSGGNSYGKCTTSCTLGPRCGDGIKQANEACDNGLNTDTYATSANACSPGCVLPPKCGDSKVDAANGEQCDDGPNNANTYGKCSTSCQYGPRCGDGATTNNEQCDDGAANGTSGSKCTATCTLKCGNTVIDPGEDCDDGTANNTGGYGKCGPTCRFSQRCGDGIKNGPEQCDDGKNDGTYGTCAPGCVFGPRCGDHVLQSTAGESCDDGSGNVPSGYGAGICTTRCQPAPFCGDHAVDANEVCDDGVNNGKLGSCSPDCQMSIDLPNCGDGHINTGEQCDDGPANGTDDSTCDRRCHDKCGNGIQDSPDECDDGVNDGSYNSCNPDCTLADYCGDGTQNGPEQCDLGSKNKANPYGEGTCTTSCRNGPFCGDGRIQTSFGEECDGTSGCGNDCKFAIPK